MAEALSLLLSLLLMGILFLVGALGWSEFIVPKSNKFSTFISNRIKYNSLFGSGNWKIKNYSYSKKETGYSYEYRTYQISESYKIKIINKSKCKSNHLNEYKMENLSKKLKLYDWQLLYNYNQTLYFKMKKYINYTLLKNELMTRELGRQQYIDSIRGKDLDPFSVNHKNFELYENVRDMYNETFKMLFIEVQIKE